MAVGFLDLAYLIEISIVFNLAYREVKPLLDQRKLEDKIQKILDNKELQDTVKSCKKSDDLAGEAVSNAYDKFTKSKDLLQLELTNTHEFWININIIVVLSILIFSTIYGHIYQIEWIVTYFEQIWWFFLSLLIISIVIPIILIQKSNQRINKINSDLDDNIKIFLEKFNRYLTEKAKKQGWN